MRHVLLTTDLSKHAGAAADAAVAMAPHALRVDCLIVCGKHGQGIALAIEML